MKNHKTNEIFELLFCRAKQENNIGLLSGSVGMVLSLFYAHQTMGGTKYKQKADEVLNVLSEKIGDCMIPSHCNGLAGIGWVFQHLNDKGWLQTDTNILLEDFDVVLAKIMQYYLSKRQIDFLHEATGIAFYFFSRHHDNQSAIQVLRYYMTLMHEIVEKNDDSMKWETILDHKKHEEGYNISLSHGMSSIVALLSKLYSFDDLKSPELKK